MTILAEQPVQAQASANVDRYPVQLPKFDDYLISSKPNHSVAIAVLLEHRIFNESKLVDVLCDGSFADTVKTIRAKYSSQWAIADSWEIHHGGLNPVYLPIAG